MKAIFNFFIAIAVGLSKLRNLIRLLETSNISYYSYKMRELAISEFKIETYDLVMFGVFSAYLVYMIWFKPTLKGKYKTLHILLKITFHLLIFGLVFYETGKHSDFEKMGINLGIYLIIEVVILILESTHKDK